MYEPPERRFREDCTSFEELPIKWQKVTMELGCENGGIVVSIYDRMRNRAGGVRVDTRLDFPQDVRAGEPLSGTVVLQGGAERRHVTRIEFQLIAEFLSEKNKHVAKERGVIHRIVTDADVAVGPGEEKRVPFRFTLPLVTPVSLHSSRIWLETAVNVETEAVRHDQDGISVLPHPVVQRFFEAVKLLGLRLDEVSLLHAPHLRGEFPYVQEFEFKPRLPSPLDELEVYFMPSGGDRVDFFIEIDRRAKGLTGLLEEAFDWDERHLKLTLTKDELVPPEELADRLARMIVPHLKS
jgi:sporulation-control protein